MNRAIASLSVIMMMTVSTAAVAQDAVPAAPDAVPAASVAAPAAASAPAQAAPADPAVFEVLRATDRDMSCADLAYETNRLNAWLLANQQATVTKAKNAKAASGLMRSAGRFGLSRLPGIGGMGAKALDMANNVAADAVAENGMPTGITTPQQQRMSHLLVIYKDKAC
jgi:hypothetical protein